MGRKTEFLNLHLPDGNDVYDVEIDQNQNFEKIDNKLKEWSTGKEPTINKKTGFNLDKTDSYEEDDTSKIGTARALKRLYDEIIRRIGAIKLTWDSITGKPNISSSVSSTSESDLANSKAVKTANDNANGRVAKTGDNMSGDLIINGHRAITVKEMAQSLGLEYAGDISEVGEKEVGKAYWHSASKKLYKCVRATTATSPAVDDFLPVDNNSLLDRLENLFKHKELIYIGLCFKLNDFDIKIPANVKSITILENTGYYVLDTNQKILTVDISTFKSSGFQVNPYGGANEITYFYNSSKNTIETKAGRDSRGTNNTCVIYFNY